MRCGSSAFDFIDQQNIRHYLPGQCDRFLFSLIELSQDVIERYRNGTNLEPCRW